MRYRLIVGLVLASVMINCGGPKTAEEYWQVAQQNADDRQFATAVKALDKLIDKFPDSSLAPKAQFQIADLYLNGTGQMDDALEAFAITAELYPEMDYGIKSLFMMGFVQSNYLQDFEKAKIAYEKFLERYPDHELVASVRFELDNLGIGVEDIETLQGVIERE